MNKPIYKIGFFVLLAINIGLVVLFSLGPKRPPQRPQAHQMGIKEEIARELDLSEEQKADFDQMAMAHREKMNQLEHRLTPLMQAYFEQLTQENPENEEILEQIQSLNRQKIEVTYRHFEELKGICTDRQLERFDEVMAKILPALSNSGPAGSPPGGPPTKE